MSCVMRAPTGRLLRCPCSCYDPAQLYLRSRSLVPEPFKGIAPGPRIGESAADRRRHCIGKPSGRTSIGFFSGLNVNFLPRGCFQSSAMALLVLIRPQLSSIRSQTRRTVIYIAYFSRGNFFAFKASEIKCAYSSTSTATSEDAYTKSTPF
jgi:hypothetical protein